MNVLFVTHSIHGCGRLDVGDGRQVELEKCSRAKLQKQQINYLSPVMLFSFLDVALRLK